MLNVYAKRDQLDIVKYLAAAEGIELDYTLQLPEKASKALRVEVEALKYMMKKEEHGQ